MDCQGISTRRVVKKIVTEEIAAFGPISSHREGTCSFCFLADMVDVVVFDGVFVAFEVDGAVGAIVDEIVGGSNADPGEVDGRVCLFGVVDVVVEQGVAAGCERFSIAALDIDAPGVEDITALNSVGCSACDFDCGTVRIVHCTPRDVDMGASCDVDACAGGIFQ